MSSRGYMLMPPCAFMHSHACVIRAQMMKVHPKNYEKAFSLTLHKYSLTWNRDFMQLYQKKICCTILLVNCKIQSYIKNVGRKKKENLIVKNGNKINSELKFVIAIFFNPATYSLFEAIKIAYFKNFEWFWSHFYVSWKKILIKW